MLQFPFPGPNRKWPTFILNTHYEAGIMQCNLHYTYYLYTVVLSYRQDEIKNLSRTLDSHELGLEFGLKPVRLNFKFLTIF